jgi:hypothetical protein
VGKKKDGLKKRQPGIRVNDLWKGEGLRGPLTHGTIYFENGGSKFSGDDLDHLVTKTRASLSF